MTDLEKAANYSRLVEAARQALEALERIGMRDWVERKEVAITVLRQALEQAEFDRVHDELEKEAGIHVSQQCVCGEPDSSGTHRTDGPCYAQQPAQQEPVAWRNAAIRVGEDLCSVGPFGYYDMTAEQWLDWALSVVTVHEPPRPQAREPLTDEQIEDIWADCPADWDDKINVLTLARAIEAAHGIKENA